MTKETKNKSNENQLIKTSLRTIGMGFFFSIFFLGLQVLFTTNVQAACVINWSHGGAECDGITVEVIDHESAMNRAISETNPRDVTLDEVDDQNLGGAAPAKDRCDAFNDEIDPIKKLVQEIREFLEDLGATPGRTLDNDRLTSMEADDLGRRLRETTSRDWNSINRNGRVYTRNTGRGVEVVTTVDRARPYDYVEDGVRRTNIQRRIPASGVSKFLGSLGKLANKMMGIANYPLLMNPEDVNYMLQNGGRLPPNASGACP